MIRPATSLRPRFSCAAAAIGVLLMPGPAWAQSANPEPLERLSILIGSWDVEDVYRPITGAEIRERGVRTCAWTLRNRYMECVTVARNEAGREREYRWLINYNSREGRYDLVGIFTNWSGKVRQTIRIDTTGSVWDFRAASDVSDGIEQWAWARLVFDGRNRALWTSYRNLETQAPMDWTPSSRETWIRQR